MDPLLQPYKLKHLEIRNRIISTAHEPAYTQDGLPKERYRLYHVEKARGGIGLTMIGGSSVVAEDSPQSFGNILLYKDESVRWLKELTDAVHDHGAAVMIQITHLGRRTRWHRAHWLPVIAPSPVREPDHRCFPKAMEDWDIERVIKAYADGAERAKAAGLDGIEIECYGHLIDQFWSPLTNTRNDEYGGTLDNRMRFSWRVIDAIRQQVGPEYIVGVRMVCDEQLQGGITRHEGLEIARRMAGSEKIDFINVIRGHVDTEEGLSHVIPGMGSRSAPHLDFAGEVRAEARLTTMHAARIQDIATARFAIESGKLDLVGMTRAHMAEPHIVAKIAAGREMEIRPCVGMGYCIDSIYNGEAACVHNAATGREATMPHVTPRTSGPIRKVVVIGAGPAGLEAARVAAERGHQVVVLEAGSRPGGQVRIAAGLKRRKEIMGIIDWRMAECEKHGVEFRYDCWAEADDVCALQPDVVVIATGGLPNLSFLSTGEEHATSSWDILTGTSKPGGQVIVYDDNGAHPGMTVAEFLVEAGAEVEIVTPERSLAPDVGGTTYPSYFTAFAQANVRITINLRLTSIRRDGNQLVAVFFDEYGKKTIEKTAEQVVVEHGTLPADDLYWELKERSLNRGEIDYRALIENQPQTIVTNPGGQFRLFRIGDAVASRNIHAAIFDALRLLKDV